MLSHSRKSSAVLGCMSLPLRPGLQPGGAPPRHTMQYMMPSFFGFPSLSMRKRTWSVLCGKKIFVYDERKSLYAMLAAIPLVSLPIYRGRLGKMVMSNFM